MSSITPFFVLLISTGIVFIIAGFIQFKYPPKFINDLYGYRTSRSMKNQETWDYAQVYSSKKMITYGAVIMLLSLIGLFDVLPVSFFNMFLGILTLALSCIMLLVEVENELKKKFGKNEN